MIIGTTLPTGSMVPRLQTEGPATVHMTAVRASPFGPCQQAQSACWWFKYFGTWDCI